MEILTLVCAARVSIISPHCLHYGALSAKRTRTWQAGSLAKARRLSKREIFTGFRKSLAKSELVSPGAIEWIESAELHRDSISGRTLLCNPFATFLNQVMLLK